MHSRIYAVMASQRMYIYVWKCVVFTQFLPFFNLPIFLWAKTTTLFFKFRIWDNMIAGRSCHSRVHNCWLLCISQSIFNRNHNLIYVGIFFLIKYEIMNKYLFLQSSIPSINFVENIYNFFPFWTNDTGINNSFCHSIDIYIF